MLKVICHKWKLKQMCERQGCTWQITSLFKDPFSGNYPMQQDTMFYALPSNWLQSHLVAKWQKDDSLETCPSAGLNRQSMALQVSWHQNLWNENLAQNTFLHTSICFFQCWHMLRAKREISRSEQAGFCNHWLQYFMSCECEECKNHQEAKKGAHRTRYMHWVNKQEGGERECVRCSLHLYPPVSPINYNPIVSTRFSLQKF